MKLRTATDRAKKWAEDNAKLRARIIELEEENATLSARNIYLEGAAGLST